MLVRMILPEWQEGFRRCYIEAAYTRNYEVTKDGAFYWLHVEDITKFLSIIWLTLHLLSKEEVPSVICQRRYFVVADNGMKYFFQYEYGAGLRYGCV